MERESIAIKLEAKAGKLIGGYADEDLTLALKLEGDRLQFAGDSKGVVNLRGCAGGSADFYAPNVAGGNLFLYFDRADLGEPLKITSTARKWNNYAIWAPYDTSPQMREEAVLAAFE